MNISSKWYGWIPTNLGKIHFDFISEDNLAKTTNKFLFHRVNSNHIEIQKLNLDFISDSSFISKIFNFFRFKEIDPQVDIIIKNRSTNIIYGYIKFYYQDSISFDIKFILFSNGKVKFELINIVNNNIDISTISYEIKQIVYVVLKLIIHGDNHHHQKMDTALKIVVDSFNTNKILDDMLLHIKTVEKNIKTLSFKCSTRLKQNISLDEVKGYISYINTFNILFKVSQDKLQIAKNIELSLESILSRREKRHQAREYFQNIALTFIGFLVATNILINNFINVSNLNILKDYDRLSLFNYSFLLWFVTYFTFIKCNFKSWLFYNYYKVYRFLVALFSMMKYIFNFIGLIILLMSLLSLIFGFYFMYKGI